MNKFYQNDSENTDFLDDYDNIPVKRKVPAGVWKARVRGWKRGPNHKGTPCVRFSLEIRNKEYAGTMIAYDRFFTDAAKEDSKRFCMSLGIDPRRAVTDYPPIYVEVKTQLKEGRDDGYADVVSVRKLNKPPMKTVNNDDAEGDVPGAL